MLELILFMAGFLYSAFFSIKFLWLFAAALAIFGIRCYFESGKNKK